MKNIYMNIKKRIRMEFSPWGFTRNFIIFPVRLFFQKRCKIGNQDYKKLRELKNKHLGERCFIIATGPSLTIEDVKLLKNEVTIGENTIFRMYPQLEGWRPTYYAMTDNGLTSKVLRENKIDINDMAKQVCLFNALNKKEIVNCNKVIFVDTNWLDHCYHYGKSNKFKYNEDLTYCIYDVYSITQECILYAIYMGFKTIYLLGADNNYLGNKQHFSTHDSDVKISHDRALLSQAANDMGYEFVNSIAKKNNVKIFNATRGGNIKEFIRVKLEDVLLN